MYKISIIGAGNVGGLAALRILSEGMGKVVLVDKIKGLAFAKELDLRDSQALLRHNYDIVGTDDISQIQDSDIVIITAGLTRKPDMSREDLLIKNAEIIKDISLKIKELCPEAIIIVVSNPVDILTYLVLKITDFKPSKVMGMGISLDNSRFINLISEELNLSPLDIEAMVIGSHGRGMLPLPRLTKIKGIDLDEFLNEEKINNIVKMTINRGAQIVSLLGSGSAYIAPSAAIAELVKVIIKDEKRTIGISCYVNAEYNLKDVCIGLPCRIGRRGIEKIVELELNQQEKEALLKSAQILRKHIETLKRFFQ